MLPSNERFYEILAVATFWDVKYKKGVLIFIGTPFFYLKHLIICMESIENLISVKTRNLLIFFMLIMLTFCLPFANDVQILMNCHVNMKRLIDTQLTPNDKINFALFLVMLW
jgi:hypothetical protein